MKLTLHLTNFRHDLGFAHNYRLFTLPVTVYIGRYKFMFSCLLYELFLLYSFHIYLLIRDKDISRLLYQQYVCRTYEPVHIVASSLPSESW